MRILLVEDEVSLANAVKKILEQQGYVVDAVNNGRSAVDYALGAKYNLIILDVMLPEINGMEVLKTVRKQNLSTPVLMLTALSALSDKVTGLNHGADDYMTKPFETEELLARVGALTRRTGDIIMNRIEYKDLSLDLNSAVLSCGNESVQLSHKEFGVIKVLLYNPTMMITTESIIENVWGSESEATDNNVEVYISFIRKKLKYLGSKVTVRKLQRLGYRLEVT